MTALTMGVAGSVTALLTVLRGGLWVFGDSLRATPLGRLLAGASGGLERTVADTATLLGVLAVAVALLVTLSGRRQEIGLLRAFGWRTVAVLRATALESAILALGGGVAGSHLAATLAAAVGSVAQTDAAYAAQQALLAPVLATILAAIYPVVLVTRVPPLQAMGRTP